jgi:hypothetical protein
MPFDGVSTKPEIVALEALLAVFDYQDSWVCGRWRDADGRVCIEQALRDTTEKLRIELDGVYRYLGRAVLQNYPPGKVLQAHGLIGFNDVLCSGREELRDTIRLAIVLATNYELDCLPYLPDAPRGYQRWAGWSSAARSFWGLDRSPRFDACQLELSLEGGADAVHPLIYSDIFAPLFTAEVCPQ